MTAFPPLELDCPDPAGCPVIDRVPDWAPVGALLPGQVWYRAYDGQFGRDEYNPGYGDTRFAPIESATGRRVPTMYLAADETSALLETIFHTVDAPSAAPGPPLAAPTVPEGKLRSWLVTALESPTPAQLADFRDPALAAMGVERPQLITSPAEHYPCTRRIATAVHHDPRGVAGIIWHSRQAELTGHGAVETVVLFGDRHVSGRGQWIPREAGSRNLFEGPGRDLAEQAAARLGARIV